jgi:hypothetical protein
MDRGGGNSIVSVGTCRANHFFVADPHDPTDRRALTLDKDQIRRAKHRIGAVARRQGFGVDGGWIWKLGAQAITR